MFKHKKSMRLKLGVKFEAGELEIDPFDDEEEDETNHPDFESYHKSQIGKKEIKTSYITNITEKIWSTKYKVCTKSNLKALIDEQYEELNKKFEKLNDLMGGGSKWIIYRWHYIFAEGLTIKPQRGSSYIPTPEKYANPKCGLINIQNKDQECFRWCMKYHQAGKIAHGERTTVLEKITDNYIYNISYPTTFEDINKFEIDNQVSVFVYYINDDNSIRTEKKGNEDYILKDVVYLLRIENDEHSHYIYIKHLERLFNRN